MLNVDFPPPCGTAASLLLGRGRRSGCGHEACGIPAARQAQGSVRPEWLGLFVRPRHTNSMATTTPLDPSACEMNAQRGEVCEGRAGAPRRSKGLGLGLG